MFGPRLIPYWIKSGVRNNIRGVAYESLLNAFPIFAGLRAVLIPALAKTLNR